MDRSSIAELLDYTEWAWERTARVLDTFQPEQYQSPPPGLGWAPAQCVEHLLGGYDMWLNTLFELGPELLPDGTPTPDWQQAKDVRGRLMAQTRHLLRGDEGSLFEARALSRGGEPLASRSLADVITDLLLHERGHYGDFTTFFSSLGAKRYFNDYIIFKTEPGAWYEDE
jgi:hypothetical protein